MSLTNVPVGAVHSALAAAAPRMDPVHMQNSPRYVPGGFFMNRVVNPITVRLGGPTLIVRGRKSGRLISVPVPPFEYGGVRYFVGGRGETNWVRNLRAAGKAQFRQGRIRESFRPTELHGAEHDRVLSAYRISLGRRVAHFFEVLPNLADHPVFRMDVIA